jgi:arabinan endo-1,5-alpha-L-arabinosidase
MKQIKWFNHFFAAALLLGACSENNIPNNGSSSANELFPDYKAPDYADDYSPIAGWNLRSQWNLANVHDPTVEKCGDYFYMYGTDASYGNVHEGHGHFPYRRSKDLVNWEFLGLSMNEVPAWVKDTLNQMRDRQGLVPVSDPQYGCWAPVVRKAGNKYRMYYCIVIDNYILSGKANTSANFDNSWTERAFIGLRETDDLASNRWEDKGMVVSSSTDKGTDWYRPGLNDWNGYFKWNAIDPTYIITPEGEHYLIYGSWHSGLVALPLNAETGKPDRLGEPWDINALSDYGTCIYTRDADSRWQASEAPECIYNASTGYYYLFVAYDELSVAYNTRVCRSTSVKGPYTDYTGRNAQSQLNNAKPILTHPYKFNNHSGWVGLSHVCIFTDGSGNWFYASQGRLPVNTGGNASSNAIMMGHVRKMRWTDDGWPVVMPERYAAVPDVPIQEQELVGSWENIVLQYQIGRQQTSKPLTLTAEHKASGALSGEWSWNAQTKTLTVGYQKLYVEREVDWEISPRRPTVVYAGLSPVGESLWGKKIED